MASVNETTKMCATAFSICLFLPHVCETDRGPHTNAPQMDQECIEH